MIYVAYGSNMDEMQMMFRCPLAKIVGLGNIDGYRLMYKSHYATIEPDANASVPVVLWDINAAHERRLDSYEGYPSFYYKKTIAVQKYADVENGNINKIHIQPIETVDGMVYIMHEHNDFSFPSIDYYQNIAKAYDTFGFSKDILTDSVAYTKQHLTVRIKSQQYLYDYYDSVIL